MKIERWLFPMPICSVCGLPDELCVCLAIAQTEISVEVRTEKRSYGKFVTIVEGLNDSKVDLKSVAKLLKSKCATGGTIKKNTIELQGLQTDKVKKILVNEGYTIKNT
jgi:translation initiation factor 1